MTASNHQSFIARAGFLLSMYEPESESAEQIANLLEEALKLLSPPEVAVPFQEIVDLYHKRLPMLAKVSKLTETRKRQLAKRWTEDKAHQDLQWWDAYFARGARSNFLTGRGIDGRGANDRSWKADFDFFMQPKSMTRVLEGFYGDDTRRQGGDLVDSVMFERGAR